MNKLLSIALMAALASLPVLADDTENTSVYTGYSLVFNEDFDSGSTPDTQKWEFETGMRRNHENQVYTTDNATIENGMLVIEARKEKVRNPDYQRYSSDWNKKDQYGEYSSASIILKDPYRYHYGIYEVRAKIPVGQGYWPAIWGCGNTYEWPYNGELDIMEYYGDAIHANAAWGSSERWNAVWNSKAVRMSEFEADFADKFHIWRTEWNHNTISIYLDDRLLNEIDLDRTVNANPGQSFYNVDGYNPYRDPENTFGVWLNLALGGDNGGSLTDTEFPAQYLVDYVRVYLPESADAALRLAIARAQKLLADTEEGNGPLQYTSQVRAALSQAIDDASAVLGSTDDNAIDAAEDAVKKAIETYLSSVNNPCATEGTYVFRHKISGCLLSSGELDGQNCVLIADAGTPGCGQQFSFVTPPANAAANGFNIVAADGRYVYRDTWNLFLTDDASRLAEKDFIFSVEVADGNLIIKNAGTGKYFGTDVAGHMNHVYSDKSGKGNHAAYFELAQQSAVENIIADNIAPVTAVYNLQGIKVADSLDDIRSDGNRRMYIVVRGNRSEKIIY